MLNGNYSAHLNTVLHNWIKMHVQEIEFYMKTNMLTSDRINTHSICVRSLSTASLSLNLNPREHQLLFYSLETDSPATPLHKMQSMKIKNRNKIVMII